MFINRGLVDVSPTVLRRRLLFYIKLIISVGLLSVIVVTADLREIALALREANYMLVLGAAALNPVGGILTAMRWQGLLRTQGIDAPLLRLIQSCVVASFFRQFLPSTIGGDAVRAYDSWKLGASKSVAVSTLAVDRMFGVTVLLLFAIVAIVLSPQMLSNEMPLLPLWVLLATGVLSSVILFIFMPESRLFMPVHRVAGRMPRAVQSVVSTIAGSFAGFKGHPGLLVKSLALSVALQVNVVTFYCLIGAALNLPVPILAYLVIVPIASIIMMIPVTINGIGLREGVFVFLLGVFAVGNSEAIAFAWLEYGLFLFYGVIGGIIYTLRK